MGNKQESREEVAGMLLRGTGLSLLDAVRLTLEMCESMPGHVNMQQPFITHCRNIVRLGAEAYECEVNTVSFREAFERSLQSRSGRRLRTLSEIRQNCHRIALRFPDLFDMPVRNIRPDYCRELIMETFPTQSARKKGRIMLHGIFSFCLKHGWCSINPIDSIEPPAVQERPIEALNIRQVRRLLAACREPEHLPCAPALGLMLWAGIRPAELTRLHWEDVRIEDKVILISARHSKTGGARHVTLHPVLIQWLNETARYRVPNALIVPRGWVNRWRALRDAAGFPIWSPDTLRHTFASYHLKFYGSFEMLQIDMGHADTQLLRTRYLSMKGITKAGACEFWGHPNDKKSSGRVLPHRGK